MATKKTRKHKPPSQSQDVEALKSDVASFASSIGLASSSNFSGFDDSDFRKKGPLENPDPKTSRHNSTPNPKTTRRNSTANPNNKTTKPKNNQPIPKKARPESSFNSLTDLSNHKNLWNDKFKNLPNLPLVRPNAVGTWYVDAAELEEKVLGNEGKEKKNVVSKNLQEWKDLVEKKKELGEMLLAQYVGDYESSRGQSGDIKMLIATQRSGTAADKVSAFSVMVGDNAIANIRSLDVLLGKIFFLGMISSLD